MNVWRRGRDSNPRYSCPYTGLANLRLQPLGHLSAPRQDNPAAAANSQSPRSALLGAHLDLLALRISTCLRCARASSNTSPKRRSCSAPSLVRARITSALAPLASGTRAENAPCASSDAGTPARRRRARLDPDRLGHRQLDRVEEVRGDTTAAGRAGRCRARARARARHERGVFGGEATERHPVKRRAARADARGRAQQRIVGARARRSRRAARRRRPSRSRRAPSGARLASASQRRVERVRERGAATPAERREMRRERGVDRARSPTLQASSRRAPRGSPPAASSDTRAPRSAPRPGAARARARTRARPRPAPRTRPRARRGRRAAPRRSRCPRGRRRRRCRAAPRTARGGRTTAPSAGDDDRDRGAALARRAPIFGAARHHLGVEHLERAPSGHAIARAARGSASAARSRAGPPPRSGSSARGTRGWVGCGRQAPLWRSYASTSIVSVPQSPPS